MKRYSLFAGVLVLGLSLANPPIAGAAPQEESYRQSMRALVQLDQALRQETTVANKFAAIDQAMRDCPSAGIRRDIVKMALRYPGAEQEAFLAERARRDDDAEIRIQAATALGHLGSPKSLAVLLDVAENGHITFHFIGDVGGPSSARRAATFAVAELAERFPQITAEAAAGLRALVIDENPKDQDGLPDVRTQALYQITGDRALLQPYYARLKSADAAERIKGVVAFRFFKLKTAPAEVVSALRDPSVDVRTWAALVLGEIGDPKTVPLLMQVAASKKEALNIRCNAICSLGQMRATAAKDLLERLLADPERTVRSNAAVALFHITGKIYDHFPEGYK